MKPPWIAYLPPEPLLRQPGVFLVSRVINFGDPRCPVGFDLLSRQQVNEPRVQFFTLTQGEFQTMARA